MNIVLIPTWSRDDFLMVMLEHIQRADKSNEHHYVFLIEQKMFGRVAKYNKSIIDIIDEFPLSKEIVFNKPNSFVGNTSNLLNGYKYAYEVLIKKYQSKLVYLLEEDIFIGKDFFNFHEAVQSEFDSFCVSGVRCQNRNYSDGEFDEVFQLVKYQSLGVSFKPENLLKIVVHAKVQYYGNLSQYCKTHFPKSRLRGDCTEQDGLIDRIMEKDNLECIYPMRARAFHAGFRGYNRPGKELKGSLNERAEQLRTMTESEFNERAVRHKDIVFCDLESHKKQGFNMIQDVSTIT